MGYNIGKRFLAYLEPMVFIIVGVYGLFIVLIEMLVLKKRPQDIRSYSKLSDRIFGKLWLIVGSRLAAFEEESVVPGLVSHASGVVLEIGPGSGNQVPRFDKSRVSKIYGVEPNIDLHEALRASVKKAKLDDIYEIVPHGAEDEESFRRYGIAPNSLDTIISIQVLCSVPDPIGTVRHLYQYLKPGGKMIVYEHIQSKDFVSRMVQNAYGIIWPFFTGDCHINRRTEETLRAAADWARIDLKSPPDEDPWTAIPRVFGELTK